MKYIAIILLAVLTISCIDEIDSPHGNEISVIFKIQPDERTIFEGDTIELTAIVTDKIPQTKVENYEIVWQIYTGGGTFSNGNVIFIGNPAKYIAPKGISFSNININMTAAPKIDMRHEVPVSINVSKRTSADTGICFKRDILPIFVSNCAMSGCHDEQSHEDGFVLTNYENITRKDFKPGKPYDSEIFKVLIDDYSDDRMPPPPRPKLSNDKIDLVYRWILEGGKNTDCSDEPVGGCDTLNVTYSKTIRTILEDNCIGCHSTSDPQGGIKLDTYIEVTKYIHDGSLLGSIRHGDGFAPMPGKLFKLSNCNIRQVEIWIENGAKEN